MRAQPGNRNESSSPPRALFLLFSCLGIFLGLFAREFIETTGEQVTSVRPVSAASDLASESVAAPASTFVVNVNAVLSMPTAEPTSTATPRPTATPVRTPVLDFCGAMPAEEGQVCRMPLPTATATPTLPVCFSPEAKAGDLCQYRLTPTPEPEEQDPRLLDSRAGF